MNDMPKISPPSPAWHLAQVNIAQARAPLDSPVMAGFTSQIAEFNALADRSPGFVWRFQDDNGNALYTRPYPENPNMLFNLSVWESPDHLKSYVYRTGHAQLIRQRHE